MKSHSPSVLRRLAIAPALAALVVVALSALSLEELSRSPPKPETAAKAPNAERRARASGDEPMTLKEAREKILTGADPASVTRVLQSPEAHAALYPVLEDESVSPTLRLPILLALERDEPARALDCARSILDERDLPRESQLAFAAYGVIARRGGSEDLDRFAPRSGESFQLERHKEACRALLASRR